MIEKCFINTHTPVIHVERKNNIKNNVKNVICWQCNEERK